MHRPTFSRTLAIGLDHADSRPMLCWSSSMTSILALGQQTHVVLFSVMLTKISCLLLLGRGLGGDAPRTLHCTAER